MNAPNRFAVTAIIGMENYQIGRECIITIQPTTGYVAVTCPHHSELNGCHWWNHRGDTPLKPWLLQLHKDYTVGKLFGRNKTKEFDLDETIRGFKQWIIEQRLSDSMTRSAARSLWDDVLSCETAEDIASLRGVDEPWEFIRQRDKACIAWWWDNCWAAFTAHLKAEISAGAEVAHV